MQARLLRTRMRQKRGARLSAPLARHRCERSPADGHVPSVSTQRGFAWSGNVRTKRLDRQPSRPKGSESIENQSTVTPFSSPLHTPYLPQRALGRLWSAAREPCSHPCWFGSRCEPSSCLYSSDSRRIGGRCMSRKLTSRSSLSSLRTEAKRWLKALRAQDPNAHARLRRAAPDAPGNPGLRDVQHALAREYGFPGWTA